MRTAAQNESIYILTIEKTMHVIWKKLVLLCLRAQVHDGQEIQHSGIFFACINSEIILRGLAEPNAEAISIQIIVSVSNQSSISFL